MFLPDALAARRESPAKAINRHTQNAVAELWRGGEGPTEPTKGTFRMPCRGGEGPTAEVAPPWDVKSFEVRVREQGVDGRERGVLPMSDAMSWHPHTNPASVAVSSLVSYLDIIASPESVNPSLYAVIAALARSARSRSSLSGVLTKPLLVFLSSSSMLTVACSSATLWTEGSSEDMS